MSELRTTATPPQQPALSWCRRIKAGQKFTFTFYSNAFFGPYIHWTGARSLGCIGLENGCIGCEKNMPTKWIGYLHGYNHEANRDEWLELPNGAANLFIEILGPKEPIRGARCCIRRGNGKTAHLTLEFLAPHHVVSPSTKLPSSKTPEIHLRKLWGLNAVQAGLKNESAVPTNTL